jgi:hypothetical protein
VRPFLSSSELSCSSLFTTGFYLDVPDSQPAIKQSTTAMLTLLSKSFLSARAFAKSPIQAMTFSTTPALEKMKTHQGAAKRWKAIANGNVSAKMVQRSLKLIGIDG